MKRGLDAAAKAAGGSSSSGSGSACKQQGLKIKGKVTRENKNLKQFACLLSLQMRSINYTRLAKLRANIVTLNKRESCTRSALSIILAEMWMFGYRVVPSLRAGAWVLKFIVVYV
jgi:hypothetical protein